MTVVTDWSKKANAALSDSKKKKTKEEDEDKTFIPESETRFGVLPPWGGAWSGGGSGYYPKDDLDDND